MLITSPLTLSEGFAAKQRTGRCSPSTRGAGQRTGYGQGFFFFAALMQASALPLGKLAASGIAHHQAALVDRIDMLTRAGDQRHVRSGGGQRAADGTAEGAGAEDVDFHGSER